MENGEKALSGDNLASPHKAQAGLKRVPLHIMCDKWLIIRNRSDVIAIYYPGGKACSVQNKGAFSVYGVGYRLIFDN